MIWYIENLVRHKLEREALENLAAEADWLNPIGYRIDENLRLIWDADIIIRDKIFDISICFPNHYPHSPALVIPRTAIKRWSSHQWGPGGELCLEYGPDNWHPEIMGVQLIESAYRLLHSESEIKEEGGEAVPSRHKMTLGQQLRGAYLFFLIFESFAEKVKKIPPGFSCFANLAMLLHNHSLVKFITSIEFPNGDKWEDDIYPPPLKLQAFDRKIALLRWPDDISPPSAENLKELIAHFEAQGISFEDAKGVVLLHQDDFHSFNFDPDDNSYTKDTILRIPPSKVRLDENHKALDARRVAIVGCGSVGSKISSILARAGVEKFLLVDDDIIFPDNLVRNDLDWGEIGTYKVDGVESRIKLINPKASCEKRKHRLGGQEASGSVESLIEKLAGCDLIIDATADASVFNYLSAAIEHGKKPLIWAEVYGGGIGGLIARHRPGIEPEPLMMRRIIENWCAEKGHPIERAQNRYEGVTEENPLIADDADVSVIASHAARMAIDLLIPKNPSSFLDSVYMIGLDKGWIFEQPFDTQPIIMGSPPELIPAAALDPDTIVSERTRILELFKSYPNEDNSTKKNN